jgi:hypothetical protein
MKLKSLLALLAVTASCLVSLVGPAEAATPANPAARFTAQAEAAGLSTAQAHSLQSRVEQYLRTVGGTQVSANKIDLNGTGELVLAAPGLAAATCYYGDMCVWSGQNFTGDFLAKYICSRFYIPWTSTGSWRNNQTTGTRARFYDGNGSLWYTTPGAPVYDTSYYWGWVYSIIPC